MTWRRALPVLSWCVVFDALRAFFESFWFFGPAVAAAACTLVGSNTTVGGLIGTSAVAAACTAAATVGGAAVAEFTTPFGVIMAMAVGLIGWLTILLIQMVNNAGIFKENFSMILRYALGLLISVTPVIGALPSLTIVNTIMFRIQIKKGQEALARWEEEQATIQREEQLSGAQAQIAEWRAFEAANDANSAIPEEEPLAA